LRWYAAHARPLPWRRTRDPYRIWVSEVMLQQTRVAAVLGHYRGFLRRFPTVAALARASEDAVLTAWSGLGYYRRARMLHRAAKVVVAEHGGKLPRDRAALRALPGVGRYTAAAIGSIAFGTPDAVVDGNVERVLARLDDRVAGGEEVWRRAQALLDPRRAGDFNQAMMELGATVCLPENPRCAVCPVSRMCAMSSRRSPLLSPRAAELRTRKAAAYALARQNGSVRLVRRGNTESQMAGMWELPGISDSDGAEPLFRLRHSITNTDYAVAVFAQPSRRGKWVETAELSELPLTGLARKILRRAGLF
jgi:A/G-specific adenine glycosylase